MKSSALLDPRIKQGMLGIVNQGVFQKNVFVKKIISSGKRIVVQVPISKTEEEFSLRKNGTWVKVGEKTAEAKTTLFFPVLIRKDLKRHFLKSFF